MAIGHKFSRLKILIGKIALCLKRAMSMFLEHLSKRGLKIIAGVFLYSLEITPMFLVVYLIALIFLEVIGIYSIETVIQVAEILSHIQYFIVITILIQLMILLVDLEGALQSFENAARLKKLLGGIYGILMFLSALIFAPKILILLVFVPIIVITLLVCVNEKSKPQLP